MKRAKKMKRPIVPQPMCDFIESTMGAKLMPWQRDLVETLARCESKRVVFRPARRNNMAAVRKMCEALRDTNLKLDTIKGN